MTDPNTTVIEGRRTDTGRRVRLAASGGIIASMEETESSGTEASGPDELWIAPGFVDLQINGYGGEDINLTGADMHRRVETVKRLVRLVLASGTTSFCPTVITASFEQMRDCMTAIRLACEQDELTASAVVGIHMEGPYISGENGPRGAHPAEHVRDPDWDEFNAWLEASGGRIRLVTLAPERQGTTEFIRKLTEAGIVASIGHTAADHEHIAAAAEAGARMSTHLGNGAHPQLPRHPHYIWSQLAEDRLAASVICDGHHLHPSVVNVMHKVKGDALLLVSDAVHLAGLPPGIYRTHVGGQVELQPSGRLHMVENPNLLAGAAVSLADCVGRFAQMTGSPLATAVAMATDRPARLLGCTGIGTLEIGQAADAVTFRWNAEAGKLDVQAVYKRGQLVGPERHGDSASDTRA